MVLSLSRPASASDPGPGAGAGRADAELLRSVDKGDRDALAQLYRRHAGWLAGRLVRRSPDPGLAEEALQDTFVAVWRRAGDYDGSGEAGAWLWGIAWRCLASSARGRRLPLAPLDDAAGLAATAGHGPEEAALAAEAGARIRAAVERLPDAQRAVVLAVVFEGRSMEQVACAEGVAVGTVKSRLSRARAALKEVMEA